MRKYHEKMASKSRFNRGLLFFGIANLLWFIFRTGTKPSRIAYPCQRAALANSSALLSGSILLCMAAGIAKTEKFLTRRGKILALLFVAITAMINVQEFHGSLQPVQAVDPNKELQLVFEPRNATVLPASDIFVVTGRVPEPVDELVNLMGSHGLRFYKSSVIGVSQGPDGLIARDDVVLVKINEQWSQRGGTNTDVLRELIQIVVSHPDGFSGEIVVGDNGQGFGSMDWGENNAEDISQSTQDVIDTFASCCNVSTFDWQLIRGTRVEEYYEGNMTSGYVRYYTADPETGIYVSYPKFRTEFGTYISFKHGIWNGTGYEKRLKVINMPVLKSHALYGVTASLKHYMGVQSEGSAIPGGLANGHHSVRYGGMGTLMVETGLPTLNVVDAIWVNANPMSGPSTPYNQATRVNVLVASIDPVALDYWAAKHVLVQTAALIGHVDTSSLDPDMPFFGNWLNLTKEEIARGGYSVTTDESRMNVYVHEDQIVIIDVNASKTVVCEDCVMNISVSIENRGNANMTFNVTVYADTAVIETKEIALENGTSTNVVFLWNTTGCERYKNYTMSAYAPSVQGETEIADNRFIDGIATVTMMGDINADRKVNMKDVGTVAKAFGSFLGHWRWNANADISNDADVDMMDIGIVAAEFGKTA